MIEFLRLLPGQPLHRESESVRNSDSLPKLANRGNVRQLHAVSDSETAGRRVSDSGTGNWRRMVLIVSDWQSPDNLTWSPRHESLCLSDC